MKKKTIFIQTGENPQNISTNVQQRKQHTFHT